MTQLACRLVKDFVGSSLVPWVNNFVKQCQKKAIPSPSLQDLTILERTGELSELPEPRREQRLVFPAVERC
jgi:hypothetical protein